MSTPPAPPDSITLLLLRSQRYVARARALVADPGLTTTQAADALDHLAGMQADLAQARLRAAEMATQALRQVEDRFKPHETGLKEAREALSSALLRAKPVGDRLYGIVPHGAGADDLAEGGGSAPAPAGTRAVSACRALLDLEALRPYLGEAALRCAIEAHAKDTGRRDLQGVTYAALPASAHLPCAIG